MFCCCFKCSKWFCICFFWEVFVLIIVFCCVSFNILATYFLWNCTRFKKLFWEEARLMLKHGRNTQQRCISLFEEVTITVFMLPLCLFLCKCICFIVYRLAILSIVLLVYQSQARLTENGDGFHAVCCSPPFCRARCACKNLVIWSCCTNIVFF